MKRTSKARRLILVRGNQVADARNFRKPLPAADIPIVAFDYGMKYNILRRLRQHGLPRRFCPRPRPPPTRSNTSPPAFFFPTAPATRRR